MFSSSAALQLETHLTTLLIWPKSERWYFPAEGRDLSNRMWLILKSGMGWLAPTKAWESFDEPSVGVESTALSIRSQVTNAEISVFVNTLKIVV